jgi:hypothetical protein
MNDQVDESDFGWKYVVIFSQFLPRSQQISTTTQESAAEEEEEVKENAVSISLFFHFQSRGGICTSFVH